MDKTTVKLQYDAMSEEEILKEKEIQTARKEDAFVKHEEAVDKMTSAIVMTAFGVFFLIVLPVSIPLLAIGIPKTVNTSKARNSSNHEYNDASWRLDCLERVMAERKIKSGPEEVHGEVID